jgi:acylphosphatase
MAQPAIEWRRVLYSGNVQGVGFRYTACRIAQEFAVTGFVRNLPDGRVELVAEGAPGEIDRMLTAIAAAMRANIRGVETETGSPSGQYGTFEVAF